MNLLMAALTQDSYSGVYNGVAPNPVRMSELCSSLGAPRHPVQTVLFLRDATWAETERPPALHCRLPHNQACLGTCQCGL